MKTRNKETAKKRAASAGIDEMNEASRAGSLRGRAFSTLNTGRVSSLVEARDMWVDWLDASGSKSGKTVLNYSQLVDGFLKDTGLGKRPASDLNADRINGWINNPEWGAKRTTRLSALAALRKWVEWMGVMGMVPAGIGKMCYVDVRSLPHAQKESIPHRPITHEEYMALLTVLDGKRNPFYAIAARLAWESGLRLSDTATLEWDSFHWDESGGSHLVVWTRKRSRRINVPMTDELCDIYDMIPQEVSDGRFCFPDEAQAVMKNQSAKLSTFFGRAFKEADIPGASFHCLRTSFAQRMRREGRPDQWIALILGHTDHATTQGYLNADPKPVKKTKGGK
jgi:integrase